MNRNRYYATLAFFVATLGLITIFGGIAVDVLGPVNRTINLLNGGVLLASAWLLWRRRKVAVVLLTVSVVIYFLLATYENFSVFGLAVFSVLMPAFYWSLCARTLLIVFAYYLLRANGNDAKCLGVNPNTQSST
jgi:glucose dehydrogenase